MAWTTPRTWVTGEVVTAALMNAHVRDNLNAVNDRLDDVSYDEPSRALDTIYQNTSGALRFISIEVSLDSTTTEGVNLRSDSSTPPTTLIWTMYHLSDSGAEYKVGSAIIQPSHYYELETQSGSPTIMEWHEWDIIGKAS